MNNQYNDGYRIIRIVIVLVAILLLMPHTITYAATIESWQSAYAEIAESEEHTFTLSGNVYSVQFALPDMNSDEIPELVIYNDYYMSCSVYTFSKGVALLLDTYGGGSSYWAWPYSDGVMSQYKGENKVFWALTGDKMTSVPFTDSSPLECYDINSMSIQAHIFNDGAATSLPPVIKTWQTAYKEVLQTNRDDILNYYWSEGYEYGDDQISSGICTIADIGGDSTPELLFIKKSSDLGIAALCVYTYTDSLIPIWTDFQISVMAGGGDGYAVFMTNDRTLNVFQMSSNAEETFRFTKYNSSDLSLTQKNEIFCNAGNNYGYPVLPASFQLNGNDISKNEYEKAERKFIASATTLLMKSEPFSDKFDGLAASSLTYGEAVLYLDSIVVDDSSPNPTAIIQPAGGSKNAIPTSSLVVVDDTIISFDAYNIDGSNYFKLRDLAYAINGTQRQFEIEYDSANNSIALTSGKRYTITGGEMTGKGAGNQSAAATTSNIFLDGRKVSFSAYNIGDNNYFKLRDIGQAFDFDVTWDGSRDTIVINTGDSYTSD